MLLQFQAGANHRRRGLKLPFKAPGEGAAVIGERSRAAAVHFLGKFHLQAARPVPEYPPARGGKGLIQRIVNFLPRAGFRIAEMDVLGVDHGLIPVTAQVKVLCTGFPPGKLFPAGEVDLLRFLQLGSIVFHEILLFF